MVVGDDVTKVFATLKWVGFVKGTPGAPLGDPTHRGHPQETEHLPFPMYAHCGYGKGDEAMRADCRPEATEADDPVAQFEM